MFPGFFIGSMCLFLLVRTVLGGHRYGFHRFHGYGRGWQQGRRASIWSDFEGDDFAAEPPFRRGPAGDPDARAGNRARPWEDAAPRARDGMREAMRRFVGALRDGLHATPAQEGVFEKALLHLCDATADLRRHVDDAQRDVARALRAETFDETAFDAASRRMEEALSALRAAVRAALVDVHDVLDHGQRAALADLVEARGIDF